MRLKCGEVVSAVATDMLYNYLPWPMAKLSTFWGYIFSRENKPFKLLFQGPLAK